MPDFLYDMRHDHGERLILNKAYVRKGDGLAEEMRERTMIDKTIVKYLNQFQTGDIQSVNDEDNDGDSSDDDNQSYKSFNKRYTFASLHNFLLNVKNTFIYFLCIRNSIIHLLSPSNREQDQKSVKPKETLVGLLDADRRPTWGIPGSQAYK